ncbi:MAG: hypothetical protein VX834_00115 [Myxococcota bacterium]|nr:hypothetical protein [Myxococcota bacterium]
MVEQKSVDEVAEAFFMEEPMSLEEKVASFHKKQRRHFRDLLTITLFFAAVVWFLAGYVDHARSEFQVEPVPVAMGSAIDIRASGLVHNTYVSLEGITEHRGMSQELMRGLSLERQEFWYFRLLGSGGIFIEVEPDAERYGIATQVAVTGRVVDPRRDGSYDRLLEVYGERFVANTGGEIRIVQVGATPGESRKGYFIVLGVLLALVAFNHFSIRGLMKARKEAATPLIKA